MPRLRLAAGVRVVARGRDRLQIGIDPDRSLVVATGGSQAALVEGLLDGVQPPDDEPNRAFAAQLASQGLLAPASTAPLGVEIWDDLGASSTDLLSAAGFEIVDDGDASTPVLVVAVGEPARTRIDPLVRAGRVHTFVRVVDGEIVLGPLVQPGVGACLRCLDAHRVADDPEHQAVIHRYALASARRRRDGHGDRLDLATTALALLWAARDLRTWAGGVRPPTWSSTIRLATDQVTATGWHRHPECACAWPDE
jgi:bacteriocin biosynthesis cyclodehydratase domain-containing protein